MKDLGLIGAGAIGTKIAQDIDGNRYFDLVGVLDKDVNRLDYVKKKIKDMAPFYVDNFEEFMEIKYDIVVEAASQEAVRDYWERILERSDLMIMSVGALSTYELYKRIYEKAELKGRKIYIPSGAIVGLDGLKAAKLGRIIEVELTTKKNPASIEQTEYLNKRGINLSEIRERTVIFRGNAQEAVKEFPKNVNVAATLSFAGVGPDMTQVKIIADPKIKRNIHEIKVRGDFGEFETRIRNLPSEENPKTSKLAALSAIQTLRQIADYMQIGT